MSLYQAFFWLLRTGFIPLYGFSSTSSPEISTSGAQNDLSGAMELGTLPGTLLRPQDLKIGQKIHARDAGRYWYPAEVVETRRGRQPAAYVTYDRFPSTHVPR